MFKKIEILILVVILIISIILPLHKVYAVDSFFEIKQKEVSKQENIEMIINLNKIEYEKFKFVLIADTQLFDVNAKEDIVLNKDDNEIYIEIDKTVINLSKISLTYKISEDKKVGDTISFVACITNSDKEDESKTEKVQVSIIENKKEQDNTENKEDETQKEQDNKDSNQEKNEQEENSASKEQDKKQENMPVEDNKKDEPKQEDTSILNNKEELNNKDQEKNENTKKLQTVESSEKITNSKNLTSKETIQSVETKSLNSNQQTTETIKYKGSNNNYLSNLYIDGYDLNKEFCKDNNTYFVNLTKGTSTVNIITEKEDNTATICIHGNEDLKTGTNKIIVNITAENGAVRTYRIYAIIE